MTYHQFNLNCPMCNESLMDEEHPVDECASINLLINIGGKEGNIHLSSLYGSYEFDCDIETPEGLVAEFKCPKCNELLNSRKQCQECGAPKVDLKINGGGVAVICSRSGCKNHHVNYVDLAATINRFYRQHQYGDRANP